MPVNYQSTEGAICMTFNCSVCKCSLISLNSSRKYNETQTRIGLAFQIVSGGTYATYKRALYFGLGIEIAFKSVTFLDTLVLLHPVLKSMLDGQKGRNHMESIDPSVLGSWEHAVTSADGCWMTRGHHSKISRFQSGIISLVGFCHLCQRRRDNVVDEPLYEGTSKSMEAFATCKLFQQAKDDGMNVKIQWQDDDSASSKGVEEIFPIVNVMVCGRYAGRAHKKRLETFAKIKKVNDEKHKYTLPDIGTAKFC